MKKQTIALFFFGLFFAVSFSSIANGMLSGKSASQIKRNDSKRHEQQTVTFNVTNHADQGVSGAMITIVPESKEANSEPRIMSESNNPSGENINSDLFELQVPGNTRAGTMPSYDEREGDGEWIRYWQSGVNENALGLANPGTWHAAIRWMPEDLVSFEGYTVEIIRIFMNDLAVTASAKIWQGTLDNPVVMRSQETTPLQEAWAEIVLDDPYLIDTSQELWIGWEIGDLGSGHFPAAFEVSYQFDQLANLLQHGDNPWLFASDYNSNAVWNIEAWVTSSGNEPGPIVIHTNMDGLASFDAMPGTYSYLIEKEGFFDVSGNFNVSDSPLSIDVSMQSDAHYTVSFIVIDEYGFAVDDALVILGDMTNEPGDYTFHNVPEGLHPYTVSRTCYFADENEVFVDDHVTLEVVLNVDFMPGDANGDGTINVLDITLMAHFWAGIESTGFCFHNADINNDNVVNVLDIIGVINIFAGGKSD